MKTIVYVLIALLLVSLAGCQREPGAEEVLRAWGEAMNAGEIDTVLSYMSDDASIQLVPPPMEGHSGIFSGKAELRGWYEKLISLHSKGVIQDVVVSGDQVTASLNYTDDELKSIGVDSIDNHWVVTIRDGKIQGYTATMTAESISALSAAMARLPFVGVWEWEKGFTEVLLQFKPDGAYSLHAASWPDQPGQTTLEALKENPGDSGAYQVDGNVLTMTSGAATKVCEPGQVSKDEFVFLEDGRMQLTSRGDDCRLRTGPGTSTFIPVEQ